MKIVVNKINRFRSLSKQELDNLVNQTNQILDNMTVQANNVFATKDEIDALTIKVNEISNKLNESKITYKRDKTEIEVPLKFSIAEDNPISINTNKTKTNLNLLDDIFKVNKEK